MTDLSQIGGALGLGSPVYDPAEAKGYLRDLQKETTQAEGSYNELVAKRRERLDSMQTIVDQATKALLTAREGRVNLPLLAASSAMMMPTKTGSFGESLGAAGLAAAPFIERERASNDANVLQSANLKTIPLTMGETIDKDAQAQMATRTNALLNQRLGVTRGMMTAQAAGAKLAVNDINALRKQAAQEAKNQMASAIRSGEMYAGGDEATIERQLTDAIYAKRFFEKFGKWPAQVAGSNENMTPKEIEATVPKMPEIVGNSNMRKQAANEAKAQMSAAQKSGALYTEDEAEVERKLTEDIYAKMFTEKYGRGPQGITPGGALPSRIEKESKDDLKKIGEIRDAGNTGQNSFNNLSAIDFEKTPQGVFAPVIEEFGRWASSLGMSGETSKKLIEQSANITEFKKITAQTLQEIQNKAKGTQTEGDAKRIAEAMQRVTNSKEANHLIRGFLQSQNLLAMYEQDTANQFVARQRNRATGIDKFANEQARMPITHTVDGRVVTLYDTYNLFRQRNPNASADEALRGAVAIWKRATGG